MCKTQYVYQFDVAAVALCALLLVIHVLRRGYPTRTGHVFFVMLLFHFLASVADLVSAFTIPKGETVPLALNYLVNAGYLFFCNGTSALFALYVYFVTKNGKVRRFECLFPILVMGLDFLMIATSPLTKLIFYFDEAKTYQHGALFPMLYAGTFLMLFYAGALVLRKIRDLNTSQRVSILGYIVVIVAAVLFQFFYSNVLISMFVGALLFVMLYIALENPSDYMYKNTFCYNDAAYSDYIERKTEESDAFSVVLLTPENVDYIRRALSSESTALLTETLIDRFHEMFGRKRVFYLHRSRFAILSSERESADEIVFRIRREFSETMTIGEAQIGISFVFRMLKYPTLLDSLSEMKTATGIAFEQADTNGVLRATDLTKEDVKAFDRKIHVLQAIRHAIENDGFRVYYQPIYDVKAQKFTTAEALLRLYDTKLGFVSPDEFIPAAEENGLIVQIGEMVFETVCRAFREQRFAQLGISFIEINLSAMQCIQTDLSARLECILSRYGLPPKSINLEITETAAATSESLMRKNMEDLSKIGITFSLDDFGTGYSNTDYLANLPLSIVKIDKTILWKAMENEKSLTVLRHTFAMVRELGFESVCEGVETQEMADRLTVMGCNYFQGFLYSKPIPEKQFIDFLREKNGIV